MSGVPTSTPIITPWSWPSPITIRDGIPTTWNCAGNSLKQSTLCLRPRRRGRIGPLEHGLLEGRSHAGWVFYVLPAAPRGLQASDGAYSHQPGAIGTGGRRVG